MANIVTDRFFLLDGDRVKVRMLKQSEKTNPVENELYWYFTLEKRIDDLLHRLSLPCDNVGLYFGKSFYRCMLIKVPPLPHSMAVLWPVHRPWVKARLQIQQCSHDTTNTSPARHGQMTTPAATIQTCGVAYNHCNLDERRRLFIYLSIALIMFL